MIWKKEDIIKYLEWKDWIFEITKKQEKNIRSLRQNKYFFWVIVKIISDYHWFTTCECYELLKASFGVSTFTNLDTWEFKFLIDSIIDIWKTKYWVIIPLPNDILDETSLFNSLWF